MKPALVLSLSATKFQALALREDLARNLALLKEMGFEGVELAVRNPSEIEFKKLNALLDENQLSVPALGTGQAFLEEGLSLTSTEPEVRHKARERLVLHLELSAKLKAMVIIGLIRGVPKKEDKEIALKLLAEELSWLCDKAKRVGSPGFVLEPLNRYETSIINNLKEAMALIRQLSADNLGILADSFHMNIEEKNIFESILSAGNFIRHIHLADSNRLAPGQGHFDFDQLFSALKKIRYNAWVSGEYIPEPDPEQSVRLFAEFLKKRKLLTRTKARQRGIAERKPFEDR